MQRKLDYVEKISGILNEKYELVVPEQVLNELNGLKDDKLKKFLGKINELVIWLCNYLK